MFSFNFDWFSGELSIFLQKKQHGCRASAWRFPGVLRCLGSRFSGLASFAASEYAERMTPEAGDAPSFQG